MQKPTPTPLQVSLPTCAERARDGRTDTKLRPKANSLVILQFRLFPFPKVLCRASVYLPPAKDPVLQMLNPMNSNPCPGKEAKTLLFLKAEASVPTNIQYLPLPLTGKLSRAETQGKGKILTDQPINLSVLCQRRRFPESTRRELRAPAPTRSQGHQIPASRPVEIVLATLQRLSPPPPAFPVLVPGTYSTVAPSSLAARGVPVVPWPHNLLLGPGKEPGL